MGQQPRPFVGGQTYSHCIFCVRECRSATESWVHTVYKHRGPHRHMLQTFLALFPTHFWTHITQESTEKLPKSYHVSSTVTWLVLGHLGSFVVGELLIKIWKVWIHNIKATCPPPTILYTMTSPLLKSRTNRVPAKINIHKNVSGWVIGHLRARVPTTELVLCSNTTQLFLLWPSENESYTMI